MNLCRCGSGLASESCHDPARALTPRLRALAHLHDLAALCPFVRPAESRDFTAFADDAEESLGDSPMIPPAVVEGGLTLLDEHERRRLVVEYAIRCTEQWSELVRDVGDEPVAARALAASAVRGAIGDRSLPPRRALEFAEQREDAVDSGGNALLFMLSPAGIWSMDELAAAARALREHEHMSRPWIAAANAFAEARLEAFHLERVRVLGRHVAIRLPFEGLPRLSSLLGDACGELPHHDALAAVLAVRLLGKYFVHVRVDVQRPLSSSPN